MKANTDEFFLKIKLKFEFHSDSYGVFFQSGVSLRFCRCDLPILSGKDIAYLPFLFFFLGGSGDVEGLSAMFNFRHSTEKNITTSEDRTGHQRWCLKIRVMEECYRYGVVIPGVCLCMRLFYRGLYIGVMKFNGLRGKFRSFRLRERIRTNIL